jgi:hypothetical protein
MAPHGVRSARPGSLRFLWNGHVRPLPDLRDVVAVAAFGIWVAAIATVSYDNPDAVGGLGLFSVTPVLIWVAVGAVIASFTLELHGSDYRPWRLAAHVLALIVMLDGLPSLIDELPRFPTAWEHVGFIQAFIYHHHPYTDVDARFFWPGFFTAMGALVGMAGWHSALPALRWTPVVVNAICAIMVFGIARAAVSGRRPAWLAAWGFVLLNWVGQDYFSPQAFAYILFLAVLLIVMWRFDGGRGLPQRLPLARIRYRLRLRSDRWGLMFSPARDDPGMRRAGLLVVLLMICVALTMEHQLTPIFLAVDLGALALVGRSRLAYLPLLIGVFVAVWLSYAAFDFWSGNYSEIFGGGGGAAVSSNVTGRLQGSLGHEVVVYLRAGVTLVFWLVAGISALIAVWRRRGVSLGVLVCALAPFPVFVIQPYGGEGLLRVDLFTLPFMLCLAISPIRDATLAGRRSMFLVAAVSALLAPAFVITRFGNEIFEETRPSEIAAVNTLYRIAPHGSEIITINGNLPYRFENLATYTYAANGFTARAADEPKVILKQLEGHQRAYLLVTASQVEYAVVEDGLPNAWGNEVIQALDHNSQFKLLVSNRDAKVYRIDRSSDAG